MPKLFTLPDRHINRLSLTCTQGSEQSKQRVVLNHKLDRQGTGHKTGAMDVGDCSQGCWAIECVIDLLEMCKDSFKAAFVGCIVTKTGSSNHLFVSSKHWIVQQH